MSLEAIKSFFSEEDCTSKEKVNDHNKGEPTPILTGYIKREKKSQELYFELAENIKKSEELRREINKKFKRGVDPIEILQDSIECISLMTGDVVFYRQNIKYIHRQ